MRSLLAIALLLAAGLIWIACTRPDSLQIRAPELVAASPPAAHVAAARPLAFAPFESPRREVTRRDPPASAPLGRFKMTYYWMALQPEAARPTTTLYTPTCKPIARVSRKYARRLALEGTGVLRDGRTLNVARPCKCGHSPCFFEADEEFRWGAGVQNRPLSPFRSIAVDRRKIAYGRTVYIPELDGLAMPGAKPWGAFVHDGCVVADDTGGGVRGNQIDLFTAKRHHYRALSQRHRITRVTVYDGAGHCDGDRAAVQRAPSAI